MINSILILNAGANLRRAYYTNEESHYTELPIREIMWRNINRYDLIIIPSWSDQELLNDFRCKLEEFIEKGGVLLQFGCHSLHWFPFLEWKDGFNTEISATTEGKASNILTGLNFDLLRWHPEFVAHGSFIIINKASSKVLAVDNENKPVIVEVKRGKGIALFSTLDPDFHFITGSFVEDGAEDRKSEALLFLSQTITWGLSKFTETHGLIGLIWRRTMGRFGFVTLYRIALPFLFFLTLSVTGVVLIFDPQARQPSVLASLIFSALGVTLAIAQELREYRMRNTGSKS